jgi:hypothetical protein
MPPSLAVTVVHAVPLGARCIEEEETAMPSLVSYAETARGARCARAAQLADRLETGAQALIDFATRLTGAEWNAAAPGDGRPVGVVVHHVASVYPLEISLALELAANRPITDVTWTAVHEMNAAHAVEHRGVTKEQALALLARNSAEAAEAIRRLSDDELAGAAPVSLYGGATLTCQFMLEDHAVRHSYHHLARLRAALRP